MDGFSWKTLLKWIIWGYPYFRKHPYWGDLWVSHLPVTVRDPYSWHTGTFIYLTGRMSSVSKKGGAFPLPMIVGKSILTIYSLTKKPKDARHIPVKAGVQSRHSTLINVPFHFRIALSAPDWLPDWMNDQSSLHQNRKIVTPGPVVSLDEKIKGWRARRWKTPFLPNYAGTFPFHIGITSSKCVFFGALYRGS